MPVTDRSGFTLTFGRGALSFSQTTQLTMVRNGLREDWVLLSASFPGAAAGLLTMVRP